MRKLDRYFGDVLENPCPQEIIEGGLAEEGGYGIGVSGNELLVGGRVVIEAVAEIESTSMGARTTGDRICGGHGEGSGGHVGHGIVGGCGHGQPMKRSTVGEGDPPASH